MRKTWFFLITMLVVIGSCVAPRDDSAGRDDTLSDSTATRAGVTPADTAAIGLQEGAPMQTVAHVELRKQGDAVIGRIPYTYTNRTGDSVYVINCNGDVSPGLQRLDDDGAWTNHWIAPTNACLSPPVVIAPGASYSDTLQVHVSPFDTPYFVELQSPEKDRQFRLVWHSALSSYDPETSPFGQQLPIDERVSNAFMITTVE